MSKNLRELALAATPGPWRVQGTCIRDCSPGIDSIATMQVSSQPNWDADAQFIAACSPDVVIDLLDERDRLKGAFDEWIRKTEWVQEVINNGTLPIKYLGWHRADIVALHIGELYGERAALREEIERLKSQLNPANWKPDPNAPIVGISPPDNHVSDDGVRAGWNRTTSGSIGQP